MPFIHTREENKDRARIARQVAALLLLLQSRQRMPAVTWIAGELGVSVRTAYRYLDAVEQAGWPLPQRRQEAA